MKQGRYSYGGANISYIDDSELLDAANRMREATTDAEYLFAWQQYQYRYNTVLPSIPLYADSFFMFYSQDLTGFSVDAEWTWTSAILYAQKAENPPT